MLIMQYAARLRALYAIATTTTILYPLSYILGPFCAHPSFVLPSPLLSPSIFLSNP